MTTIGESPIELNENLSDHLGLKVLIKRDDLLPFPLAGNKVRKNAAELDSLTSAPTLAITNGAINSNHCRTLAMMGAQRGIGVHLVLHGDRKSPHAERMLSLLTDLGATFTIVDSNDIAASLAQAESVAKDAEEHVHVVAGGCHTPAGARAYRNATMSVLSEYNPEAIVVASGTGATQGGMVAAAEAHNGTTMIVGVSVAREAGRGRGPVLEAARWAGASPGAAINFSDGYRDGGYGLHGARTDDAVSMGWSMGLPLDPTYTGKAFAGFIDMAKRGAFPKSSTVVFWHTGGLANYLFSEPGPL